MNEQQVYESLKAAGVPEHLHGGIVRYIINGILPGGFLRSVIANDAISVVCRADEESRLDVAPGELVRREDEGSPGDGVTKLNPNKFGIRAVCKSCGLPKAPRGRSVPIGLHMCDHECPGYLQEPHIGSLWP